VGLRRLSPQIATGWSGTDALIKPLDFALVTEEESEAANSKINQLARPLAHSLSNLDGLVSRQAQLENERALGYADHTHSDMHGQEQSEQSSHSKRSIHVVRHQTIGPLNQVKVRVGH
jgi:hypothetical protein